MSIPLHTYPCPDKSCRHRGCTHEITVETDNSFEDEEGECWYSAICYALKPPEAFKVNMREYESYLLKSKITPNTNHTTPVPGTMANISTDIGFTSHDRNKLNAIFDAAVLGKEPTSAKLAGSVRQAQIDHGLTLYKPSTRYKKGVSYISAAKQTISDTKFKNAVGGYTMAEVKTLARAIQRANTRKM